jgi:uncharacterized repeat protein (TIGR03803 family)
MRRIDDSMKRIKQFGAASAVLALFITFGLAVAATPSAQAQTFRVYYSFGGTPDGGQPVAGMAQGSDGNFYGSTSGGGSNNYGSMFELSSDGNGGWNYSVVFSFVLGLEYPQYPVTLDGGYLYTPVSTTGSGGGIVKYQPGAGSYTLIEFGGGAGGCYPMGGLIEDSSGNLYGTTYVCGTSNRGTVFELNGPEAGNNVTILHNFTGSAKDGASPEGGSLLLSGTTLYGVTTAGGSAGSGVVYSLSIATGKTKVLHSFGGSGDGSSPMGTPVMDAKGNLYGTTKYGGANGAGTVWELTKKGVETVHSFGGDAGYTWPTGGVALDTRGYLYGTVYTDPIKTGYAGYLYRLNSSNLAGAATTLHAFSGGSDGGYPYGVFMDSTGNVYGTTQYGGANNAGVLWGYFP